MAQAAEAISTNMGMAERVRRSGSEAAVADLITSRQVQPDLVGPAFSRLIDAQTRTADLSNQSLERKNQKDLDGDSLHQEVFQARGNGSLLQNYDQYIARAAKLGLESYIRQQASEILNALWQQAVTADSLNGGVGERKKIINQYSSNQGLGEIFNPLMLQYQQEQKRLFDEASKKAKDVSLKEGDWYTVLQGLPELQGLDFEVYKSQLEAEVKAQQEKIDPIKQGVQETVTKFETIVYPQIKAKIDEYINRGGNYTQVITEIVAMTRAQVGSALEALGSNVSDEVKNEISKKATIYVKELVGNIYKSKIEEEKLIAKINKEQFTERTKWFRDILALAGKNPQLLLLISAAVVTGGVGTYMLPLVGGMASLGVGSGSWALREGWLRMTGDRGRRNAEKNERAFKRDESRATLAAMREVGEERADEFRSAMGEVVYIAALDRMKTLGVSEPETILKPYKSTKAQIRSQRFNFATVPVAAAA